MSDQPPPNYPIEPQQPYGQQPGAYGQQPPMNKKEAKANAAAAKAYSQSQRGFIARHKILTALGALVLLIVVIAIGGKSGGGSSGTGNAASAGSGATAGPSNLAALNTPARDGKFEFTVTAVDPGKPTVGAGGLSQTAQGQFILVHITVKNIGTKAQTFDSGSQKLTDQQGRQASASVTAGIYIDPQNFLAQINPGNVVQGVVVFDVPKDSVPVTLELHDSIFSSGVTVSAR